MEEYICKSDNGFIIQKGTAEGHIKAIKISPGDVVEKNQEGNLTKDGICLCHAESILGKYHFKKVRLK